MTPPAGLRAVLFDLDDTLYPEHQFVDGGFRAVARFVAARSGQSDASLVARLWELHARDGRGRLFDTLLAEVGLGGDPDIVLACLLLYRSHEVRLEPFPGVERALDEISDAGMLIGVLSDGQASVQRRKLAGLPGVARRLDVVVLTAELGPAYAKPSPVGYRVACRILDVPPSATVYVGNDPAKDFAGARAAGLYTVRLGRPPRTGGPLDRPPGAADDADVTLDGLELLPALLAGRGPGILPR
ncbi:MAG: HAD family hydrolase [Candidatus Limnocylindrales bacterium]